MRDDLRRPRGAATINNQAGATFDFQADATLSNVYFANWPPRPLNNAGTLETTAGSGTTTIEFPLNNSGGTVEHAERHAQQHHE